MATPHHPAPSKQDHLSSDADPAGRPRSDVLLYTPAEAAHQLQVRESWLRKKAAARQIPCTFLGKHLRFSPTDLTTIVAAAARPPVGRKPRRKPASTSRDRDLPTPPQQSVDAPGHDHRSNGSSPWHG